MFAVAKMAVNIPQPANPNIFTVVMIVKCRVDNFWALNWRHVHSLYRKLCKGHNTNLVCSLYRPSWTESIAKRLSAYIVLDVGREHVARPVIDTAPCWLTIAGPTSGSWDVYRIWHTQTSHPPCIRRRWRRAAVNVYDPLTRISAATATSVTFSDASSPPIMGTSGADGHHIRGITWYSRMRDLPPLRQPQRRKDGDRQQRAAAISATFRPLNTNLIH